jgi:alpha-aminoadipic semialdehyde synthase
MNNVFGIRHEDKYRLERRTPVIPRHAALLAKQHGLKLLVQSSPKRIFTDEAFRESGAEIVSDLSTAPVVFGVKEMPVSFFEPHKTYVFFSHVIKGQEYNMPMLRRMMELKCSLIDYEKVVD